MKRDLICIICPRGCTLTVEGECADLKVTGNACPKGSEYAIKECTNPVRTVTATIRVANRYNIMACVKTVTPVAKDKMMDVMNVLRTVKVDAPLSIGDIVLTDVCGSDIVVTKAVD